MKNIEELIAQLDEAESAIFEVNQTIAPKVAELQGKRSEIKDALDLEIAKIGAVELSEEDYKCGTANIDTEKFKIKYVVSKKIKWDEKQLKLIKKKIIDAGQDPELYMKEKLSVAETKYKDFPDNIKAEFEPARSVEPSAPKIEIVRK